MGIDLSPVWVVSLLKTDEQEDFAIEVNQQFKAFTSQVLGIDPERQRAAKWWGINHLKSDITIEDLIYRGIPKILTDAYPADATALFKSNSITLVVYANASNYLDPGFGDSLKMIVKDLAPGFVKYCYLLLEIEDSHQDNKDFADIFDDSLFHGIILMDACNLNAHNEDGYRDLYKNGLSDKKNIYARATQIILNLAAGHEKLCDKVTEKKKVFAAGGFSLFFEQTVLKSQLTIEHLTTPILQRFFNARDTEYWQVNLINEGVERAMEELTMESLYKKTVHVFDDKFKQVEQFFTHKESPWALLSASLVETYFKGELKLLLRKLVGYGRLLDAHLSSKFRNHLLGRKEQVQRDSIAFLHDSFKGIWIEDNLKETDPIGLRQFQYNLEQVEAGLNQTDHSLNTPEEFYKIAITHPPLIPPAQVYDEYKERMDAWAEAPGETGLKDSETGTEKEEENLLNQLRKKLEFHPIPLALLVRAAILGMVLSITLYGVIVAFFPDVIINTSFFEQGNGRYLWFAGVFIWPVLHALYKYGRSTLYKIKQLKQKYLAWVFYRIQLKLMDDSRDQVQGLVDELQTECRRIKTNLENGLSAIGIPPNFTQETNSNNIVLSLLTNAIERVEPEFPASYFQQDLVSPIDVTSDLNYILLPDLSSVMVRVSASETISVTDMNERNKYALIRDFLVTRSGYIALFETIAGFKPDFTVFINRVQADFMEKLTLPYTHIGEFSFTREAHEVVKARAHPSVYNYATDRKNITRFRFSIADSNKLPKVISELLNENREITSEMIPITDDSGQSINNDGFIQVCDFYRLTNTEDLRS